ncbi:MAG: hypothetical protein HYZ00_13890 [Candidatus Hydrogenedentes bacterium]|nr:hypothetical protein [Candidatus Hydrogenedentota bacterium]
MSKDKRPLPVTRRDALFDRVVSIMEQARGSIVRAVNTNMVLAYWMIGREIVEEIQRGKGRAEYGERLVGNLSVRLTERYGKGFSIPNLKSFRQLYQTYPDRFPPIGYPVGSQSVNPRISRPVGVSVSRRHLCTRKFGGSAIEQGISEGRVGRN